MKYAWGLLALGLTLSATPIALADDAPTAVGTWQPFDEKTGKPNGAIVTSVRDGKLVGQIAALRPGSRPDEPCPKCKGADKGKPLMGLVIMWGFKPDGNNWTGGSIMDPESGSTYSCSINVVSKDEIEVRGYVGVSVLGRTQHWKRLH